MIVTVTAENHVNEVHATIRSGMIEAVRLDLFEHYATLNIYGTFEGDRITMQFTNKDAAREALSAVQKAMEDTAGGAW